MHNYWDKLGVIKPVFKYPRWQSIHRRGHALEEKLLKQATVVSRPVLLTQKNVPAILDNNRTFYTKLIGERNVALEHVNIRNTIRVLPRFSADGQIEMSLDIEDGKR